jgi:hypothetical protein
MAKAAPLRRRFSRSAIFGEVGPSCVQTRETALRQRAITDGHALDGTGR